MLGDLSIHLLGREGSTLLYLGPEKEGNKEEFAKVKGMVERSFGEA